MPRSTSALGDNINDLIGNPPGWLLRSGLSTLGLVTLCGIILAAFIKYPDKIMSTGIMTSSTPPIEHRSFSTGFIDSIFVKENQLVQVEDTLLYVKNQAKMQDMYKLLDFINSMQSNSTKGEIACPTNLHVGDLQPEYASLEQQYAEYELIKNYKKVDSQISEYKTEITHLLTQNSILLKQQSMAEAELEFRKIDFDRSKNLHSEGVISDMDWERANIEHLQYEKQFVSIEDQLTNNTLRRDQLKHQIIELSQTRGYDLDSRLLKINELTNSLEIKIKQWYNQYFVVAQVAGHVSLLSGTVAHKLTSVNDPLVQVLPVTKETTRFVSAVVSSIGIGKIAYGDKALIKIDGYPYKEYGSITSNVLLIASLPIKLGESKSNYEVKISLPDSAILTNYNIEIPFKANSAVTVDIITVDKSLLQRIFNQFFSLINNP